MTKPLSVFLDVTDDIDAVRHSIATIIGHPLTRQALDVGDVYTAVAFCIDLRLFGGHGLDDDCGIEFSNYPYQLQLVPLEEGQAVAQFGVMYEGIALFIAARLSKSMNCRSLVVVNLQHQLAYFVPTRL